MTDVHEVAEPADGRGARRRRNIDAVLDVVVEMFAEEAMFPTMEQAATRSGLSLRSLYRYFTDPGELLEAAIARTARVGRDAAWLPDIGQGPFEQRVEDFVATRLRIHEAFGAVQRAAVANAAVHPRIRDQVTRDRDDLRQQFEAQFAPELTAADPDERVAVVAAGDLLTQMASIDFLRRHRGFSVAETHATLVRSLRTLLI